MTSYHKNFVEWQRAEREEAWDEAIEAFIQNLPQSGPLVVLPENPYKAVSA